MTGMTPWAKTLVPSISKKNIIYFTKQSYQNSDQLRLPIITFCEFDKKEI